MANIVENSFQVNQYVLNDADIIDLTPKTATHLSGSGLFKGIFQSDLNITARSAMQSKIRPNTLGVEDTVPNIVSGDTAHGVVIDHELFTATLLMVTDGLSPASPLWIGRIPLLKDLIQKIGKQTDKFDSTLIEKLPWQNPDLASAALIENYYLSPIWLHSLDKLISTLTDALIQDFLISGTHSKHSYPNLELELPIAIQNTILDYGEFRNEILAKLPSTLQLTKIMKLEGKYQSIPQNIFDWYLNAIFSHSVCVIPKFRRPKNSDKKIIGASITSAADTLDILIPHRPHLEKVYFPEHYLRLADPNRQVEPMIAKLSKQYGKKSKIKERLLLSKPQNIYMTYPSIHPSKWSRNHSTLTIQWLEIANSTFGNPSMTQGAITDGDIYPSHDLSRTMSQDEFTHRINSVMMNPFDILQMLNTPDDGSNFIFEHEIELS